jgi:hypothetical protein
MKLICSILLIFAFSIFTFGQRSECFPFEKFSPEKRKVAEELLLKALDSEALYTIVSDLKPMSSGFTNFQTEIRIPRDEKKAEERRNTLAKINDTREILRHFKCGENIFSDIYHFAKSFEGKRFSDAVMFNRSNLSAMLKSKSAFFERWAITENSHPLQVLYAVDYDETGARFGGYGYLFGYPDYAIRFFVQAADEEDFSGKFVERDFFSNPTFSSPKNGFVYAVPKGQTETEVDKTLKTKAMKIFEDYKTRREKYIGEGKKGVTEMIRDWLCNEKKTCL